MKSGRKKRLLEPDIFLSSLSELTPELLKEYGIKAIILDIDNTMAPPDSLQSYGDTEPWLEQMARCGIKLIILSNNKPERVEPYAKSLEIPCICDMKPRKRGYLKASSALDVDCGSCCAVGDQLFTDVLGANLSGCISCLTSPRSPENSTFIKLKRIAERSIIKRIKKRGYK